MRRCFNIDYPQREETNDQGTVVRVVTLPPVKCSAPPTLRSSIVWPSGERQHTYTCADHADKLRRTTEAADFTWDPRPYMPKGK